MIDSFFIEFLVNQIWDEIKNFLLILRKYFNALVNLLY